MLDTITALFGGDGIRTFFTEGAFIVFAALALAGAIASFIYIPVVGRPLASVLLAVSAALFAYDLGYADRGRIDNSGVISAQLATALRDAKAAQIVADADNIRTRARDAEVDQLKQKVSDYEKHLVFNAPPQVVPANCPKLDLSTCGCSLSDGDVSGLRNIGPARPSATARGAGALRPARGGS